MTRQLCSIATSLCLVVLASGCDRLDMYDQPRYEPLEKSEFFEDGLSARPPVAGTIARGELREDDAYYRAKFDGKLVTAIPAAAYRAVYDRHPQQFGKSFQDAKPAELRQALLERGRERFQIHCAVCHGGDGNGQGIVVQRGFPKPPSYHDQELREAPIGHFFTVMTNGDGPMASYASRVDVADRWAIAGYIRALQLSQHATVSDVPADQRKLLTPGNAAQENRP